MTGEVKKRPIRVLLKVGFRGFHGATSGYGHGIRYVGTSAMPCARKELYRGQRIAVQRMSPPALPTSCIDRSKG